MLRAALIGTGPIAREHLAALATLPRVEVAGLCDLSPARAQATAERFGVKKWFTDYGAMLAETRPDLVHVTTPPTSHFAIARDCLTSGLNVLCEKPITAEYEEFLELKRLAERAGLMLMENQNYRFNAPILRIRQLVASGELGDVADVQVHLFLNVNAPGSRYTDPNVPHPCLKMRGGIIADFLTHMCYLVYLFAGRPLGLRTTWSKRAADSPLPADEFRALVKGERATASMSFSGNAQPNGFWLRVAGTRMCVETNLFEPPRLVCRRLRRGPPPLATFVDGLAESQAVLRGTIGGLSRKLGGVSIYDGLVELVARTYGALEQKGPPPVPLEEIDDVARMVAATTSPENML